ncbi:MAG: hypothetical protein HW419_3539 [Deltaproteobacteria bacterium]|nr:hypothetical protein [Deltaproteobacteria bacterium]
MTVYWTLVQQGQGPVRGSGFRFHDRKFLTKTRNLPPIISRLADS